MRKLLKRLSCTFGIALILTMVSSVFPFVAEAKEQTVDINGQVYEFDKKSEYEIDSSSAISTTDKVTTLGSLSIEGDISKTFTQNGIDAYEIANDTVFSVSFNYSSKLKDADSMEWHLTEDSQKAVNGIPLDDKIKNGALILQTSLDGNKWITSTTITDVTSNTTFNQDNGINNIQLANGCYYRIIIAYETEKQLDNTSIWFVDTSDYDYKKNAEVYKFYASYNDTDSTPIGEKFYFSAGAKNSAYTVKTKTNNYAGSETIDNKDPHYGWDLGYFCLSGYTDKGDDDNVYLKKVGNKVKLTFRLDQDINSLNKNSDLVIESDKDGSDEEFKVFKHNMKHGELIIRHTDSENNTTEVNYSDYLAALASPGADTSIQLFEEGDYEVHLDYAITNKKGWDSTTYYKTSFKFKIRNANCMVYIFDSKSGAELSNGDVTENGFRIDTAKSSYPKLQVKKEILNNTNSGLVEDTRFNGAASDGEMFTDEGIYTIKAFNRYDDKLEPAVKTIYVGSNNILTAYTKHLNSSEQYTIAQLNNMVDEGYTITDSGDIIEPVVETTTITTSPSEITTTKTEITTTITSTEANTVEAQEDPVSSVPKEENTNKSTLPIVGGGVGVIALSGVIVAALKKKK